MGDQPKTAALPAPARAGCLHVAWATDAAYASPTKMSIFSASRQTPADAVFVVLMPSDDLAATDWDDLRATLRPNHSLRILGAADPRIDGCSTVASYPRSTYLRFLLSDVLPEVDRCLYLDGDNMVLDDLSLLWREIDSARPVCAVRDHFLATEGTHMQSLGLVSYFNSGVMGLNLSAWRSGGYTDACLRLASAADPRRIYQDQDVLNLVFAGQIGPLDPRWNIPTNLAGVYAHDAAFLSKQEWRRLRAHPGIAHFTGPGKPWHARMSHSLSWRYWELAAQSPWRAAYASGRAAARRRYLVCRWKHGRRWVIRFARPRACRRGTLLLFGWRINLP